MPRIADAPAPVVVRRVAYLPFWVIVAIVILRLAAGWHFYREGTKKLAYDPVTGDVRIANAVEPFLRQAVGPVGDMIREELPNVYNWERYLAVPRQLRPTTEEELDKRAKWVQDYAIRRKAAADKKESLPVEFPPHSPYYDWADRIDAGWREALEKFNELPSLTDEQKSEAVEALALRRQQLADYLGSQSDAIAEWEHELWRLEQLKTEGGAVDLPFLGTRIEEKQAETIAASSAWIAQVQAIDRGFRSDLRGVLSEEQAAKNAALGDELDDVLADKNERRLHRMNVAVTCLIIGVGVCLMLGLFTRLASLGGMAFLASVIATQPPWVLGAVPTYYQLVEIAGLLVLLASAAGRWAGLDFFIRALLGKCCRRKETIAV